MNIFEFDAVKLDDNEEKLVILDQTRLPNEMIFLSLDTKEEIYDAIYHLKVRGAPAIGVAAAYGYYVLAKKIPERDEEAFCKALLSIKEYLSAARPTAVNLTWALERMYQCAVNCRGFSISQVKEKLLKEAKAIRQEDENVCKMIGEYSLSLLKPGMGILTHCNAGTIATAKYGTALSAIYLGEERGYGFRVFADETRPLLQGARLTAWELMQAGVDVTLICDNMASIVMKNGWVQAILTGCDRVAANGDSANKIGTSGLAILAKEYQIPFYIHAPLSTVDLSCQSGKDIEIEERDGSEIYKMWYEKPMAPEGMKTYNPAFDVTDAKYITAIITEKGILRPPYEEAIRALFQGE